MATSSNLHAFEENSAKLPRYIAIEGAVGVGKTTLAKRLAATFNCECILEQAEDNPFLEKFYQTGGKHALPSQLFFLFHHIQTLQPARQTDLFYTTQVVDFMVEKDPLFARITLDDDEFSLYKKVYQQLVIDTPKPDLVIYLQASTETLVSRIQRRGHHYERNISAAYLNSLSQSFADFFHYYDEAPLLIVNSNDINLVSNDRDYHNLVDYMLTIKSGKHYYNPTSV